MSRYFLILWILYTGLMGIFVGASFDSEFFVSQNYRNGEQQNSAGNQKSLEERQEITNKSSCGLHQMAHALYWFVIRRYFGHGHSHYRPLRFWPRPNQTCSS
jgi:hypothetical protein